MNSYKSNQDTLCTPASFEKKNKKRGRPKKVVDTKDAVVDAIADAIAKPKRGRGRPRLMSGSMVCENIAFSNYKQEINGFLDVKYNLSFFSENKFKVDFLLTFDTTPMFVATLWVIEEMLVHHLYHRIYKETENSFHIKKLFIMVQMDDSEVCTRIDFEDLDKPLRHYGIGRPTTINDAAAPSLYAIGIDAHKFIMN